MCGIIGYISKQKSEHFSEALDSIAHRGPDAKGVYEHTTENGMNLQFGHRRLSIIDTTSFSNQPFISTDQQYVLIFNGEIYNFKKLKDELIQLGDSFETSGDTEVLFKFLIRFGAKRLAEINGMFAFAFYDTIQQKLIIARDHLGIKPIYYHFNQDAFLFSSELKGLFVLNPELKKLDQKLIAEYLLNGFIYEPETGFQEIYKVRPGHAISWDLKADQFEEICFWDGLKKSQELIPINQQEFQDCLVNTIDDHTLADVPIGLFYSGGVDSSIVLTNATSGLPCITVKSSNSEYKNAGFANDFEYAKQICDLLGKKLDVVNIGDHITSGEDFLKTIDDVAKGNEELIADYTYISSLMISEESRAKGFKVMLSGMGADEIFAGYPRYQMLISKKIFSFFKPIIVFWGNRSDTFRKKIDRFVSFLNEKDFGLAYTSLIGVFSVNEVNEMLGTDTGIIRYKDKINQLLSNVSQESNLKKGMYLDRFGFLSHNFTVADKSSMKASIELRVPLATAEWVDFLWKMPDSSLINLFERKKILMKQLLKSLPHKLVYRRKVGFNAPLDGYIRLLGEQTIMDVLTKDKLFNSHVNIQPVMKLIKDHFSNKKNNTYKLYQLLHFRAWLNIYK